MRRSSQVGCLTVPALEARQLLSGNVQTAVVGGTLKITGDNLANDIAIDQTVEGLRVRALGGTRLNGTTNGELTFNNPTQMSIDLKGGNDRLKLESFLGGGVSVLMGNGNDQLELKGITTDGDLIVDLGSGNDKLTAILGGPLNVDTNVVGGNVRLLGNSGNDRILVGALNALQNLTIDAGAGNDAVALGGGSTNGTSTVLLGSGNDLMILGGRTSRGLFSLNSGSGDDVVGVDLCEFKETATFDMNTGKDALLSQNNIFGGNVTRAGGTSTDTLFLSGESLFADNTITGFESQPTSQTAAVLAFYTKLNNAFPAG